MNHNKRQYRNDGWHSTDCREFTEAIPAGRWADDTHTVVTRYQDCDCPDCGHKALARISVHTARNVVTDNNFTLTTIKCFRCGYGEWYVND
jgi:predicted nucleic-acid-binding Zn-ribbon protein